MSNDKATPTTRPVFFCTASNRWDGSNLNQRDYRVQHLDAEEVYDGDTYSKFKCPHCGTRFTVEYPE